MNTLSESVIRDITQNIIPTPVYCYSQKSIQQQISLLVSNKPKNLEIFYAMKGNSAMAILQIFKQQGFGTEIASGGELFLAQKAGFPPEKILYTGPAKTDEELEECVALGIKTIHIESVEEGRRLNDICKRIGKKQSILVRMNANFEVHGNSTQLSGCASPFGISEEDFFKALETIVAFEYLHFEGLHVYNASGVLEVAPLLQNIENVFSLVQVLEQQFPTVYCQYIDFGGGLGIDYSESDTNIDVIAFYKGMNEKIEKFGFESRNLIMEISRFLVAESGFYITKILDIKHSRGKNFYICDGGIHHFMRTALFGYNHPVSLIQKNPTKDTQKATITGSLCTGIDVLASDVMLPKACIGDWVVIHKAGCYALSAAMNHFLSHQMPAEILESEGQWRYIRTTGKHEDLLLNQIF